MSSADNSYMINHIDIDKISSEQSDNLIDFNTISDEEIKRFDFNDCSIIKQAALTPLPTFEYFNSLDAEKQKTGTPQFLYENIIECRNLPISTNGSIPDVYKVPPVLP